MRGTGDLVDEVALIVADTARRQGVELVAYCEPGLITTRRGDTSRLRPESRHRQPHRPVPLSDSAAPRPFGGQSSAPAK
ncbi:MAG: hypothetical protein ACR2JF_09675 [Iamia sp.]